MPQNIDMRDRVVGPLTMVQFLYAVFGGAIAYISLNTLPKPLSYIVAVLVVIFVVCLIFVKINERPFLNFMGDLFLFTTRPRIRLWSKTNQPIKVDIYQSPNANKNKQNLRKNISKEQLAKLATTLDQRSGNETDIGRIKV